MTMLPYIGSRVLDTPLVIGQAKLEAILAVIGPRIGIEAPAPAVMNGTGGRRGAYLVTPEGIAVIPVFGTLVKRAGAIEAASGLTSYGHLEEQIMDAATDPAVRAVLLDIDSPGGEAAGVFDLSDLVYEARSLKPLWAVADEEAFSGAYAIASAAERLFVPRTGGLGSIGVVAVHVDRSARDAMEGFRTTTVYAGARKNDFNPHETLKDGARQTLQVEVDRVYGLFVDTVARNRGLTANAVRSTEARLYFGEEAVATGLADEVGTLRSAFAALAAALSTPRSIVAAPAVLPEAVIAPPKPTTGKEQSMNDDTVTQTTNTDAGAPPEPGTAAALAASEMPVSEVAAPAPQIAEVVDLDKVRTEARGEGADEAGLIAELCTLAGMPERTADMLAKGISADDVRRKLLILKAAQDAEVHNHVLPGAGTGVFASLDDNPVVRAATARAAAAKEA